MPKHAATWLHFDLRLEIVGVLKSCAVTRGPSLDPADKRLAVEDHPPEYRSFEGAIAGDCGAGTAVLWDGGRWEPALEVTATAEALTKGTLEIALHGQRLRGGGPGTDETAAEAAPATMAALQAP